MALKFESCLHDVVGDRVYLRFRAVNFSSFRSIYKAFEQPRRETVHLHIRRCGSGCLPVWVAGLPLGVVHGSHCDHHLSRWSKQVGKIKKHHWLKRWCVLNEGGHIELNFILFIAFK